MSAMAELDVITEALRRQRKDLESQLDDTSSRTTEAAVLLKRIEHLRARAEKIQRQSQDAPKPAKS